MVLCVGQGPWEVPDFLESTRELEARLSAKGIPTRNEVWGEDVVDYPIASLSEGLGLTESIERINRYLFLFFSEEN